MSLLEKMYKKCCSAMFCSLTIGVFNFTFAGTKRSITLLEGHKSGFRRMVIGRRWTHPTHSLAIFHVDDMVIFVFAMAPTGPSQFTQYIGYKFCSCMSVGATMNTCTINVMRVIKRTCTTTTTGQIIVVFGF